VQNQKKLDLILKIKPAHLQIIVVFQKFKKIASDYKIISFDDFIAIGKDSSFDNVLPTSTGSDNSGSEFKNRNASF
jgi:hypothetical protein